MTGASNAPPQTVKRMSILTYHHQRTIYSEWATTFGYQVGNSNYMTLDLPYRTKMNYMKFIKTLDIFVVEIPQITAVRISNKLVMEIPITSVYKMDLLKSQRMTNSFSFLKTFYQSRRKTISAAKNTHFEVIFSWKSLSNSWFLIIQH